MKFNGQIAVIVKDSFGCIHLYKKKSKAPADLNQYIDYIRLLEGKLKHRLIKSFVINQNEVKAQYIWSSYIWRNDLNAEISPNHQKYIKFLSENRKNIKFIGPYKSMRKKALHLCDRGHEWTIQPLKVKNGEICSQCKMKIKESEGSKIITEVLTSNKIEFVKEVSLTRFGYNRDLRLDFVICQNNYPLFAIEFNGIQHYKHLKSQYFGGYKGAKERILRDKIKREYCWEMGLPIVDIPYSDTKDQIQSTVLYFLSLFEILT